MAPAFARQPVGIVIDHRWWREGWTWTLDHPQFRALLSLLDAGNAWIKVCSYRVSSTGQPWADPAPNVRAFVARYPEADATSQGAEIGRTRK